MNIIVKSASSKVSDLKLMLKKIDFEQMVAENY